MSAALTTKNNH